MITEPLPSASRLQLTADELRTVRDIIGTAQVRVFGSRATGRARPFSDLDLLIVEPVQLTWAQRAQLRDRFEASDLPFWVDVVEADSLAEVMATRAVGESVAL